MLGHWSLTRNVYTEEFLQLALKVKLYKRRRINGVCSPGCLSKAEKLWERRGILLST